MALSFTFNPLTGNFDAISTVSLAAVGSSPNADGASISSDQVLTLQPADGTHPGLITSGTQTIGGDKTFSGNISAANLSGTNTGDVTLTAVGSSPSANGASLSGQALTLQPADGTHPGVVTTTAQTLAGAKTFSTAPILSSLTASLPLKLDASKNMVAAAIDITGSEVTGVLPIAYGGTNATTQTAAFDSLSPMSNEGDIIVGGAGGTGTRLAIGASNTYLKSNGTTASWSIVTATPPNAELTVGNANGYGSSGTKIRKYSTTLNSAGTDISYTSSATNGDSFTINTTGIYAIYRIDGASASSVAFGISVNSSSLTTNIGSLTYAQGNRSYTSNVSGSTGCIAMVLRLNATDVVRCQDTGACNNAGAMDSFFSIVRIG